MNGLSIHPLADFAQILQRPVRLAALDIGTRTIGIALSTPDWQTVLPLTTLTRSKWSQDLLALEKALKGYEIGGLVIGLPFNMDGSEGPRAQGVRQVAYNLVKANPAWLSHCIIGFCDERHSSSTAHDMSAHLKLKRAKESGALDALAATDILGRALNILKAGQHVAGNPEETESQ
ncbi:MAG: Holliday junction resolvase RuvX [Alphaproteobacteria bacterium]|nr:Holliday junction resolvase RuvX [Alphaproteobacteria bacterium]